MPDPEFFARLGLFVRRAFLSRGECGRLRTAMRESGQAPATVYEGATQVVDEDSRRTRLAQVTDGTRAWTAGRLEELRPALQAHFGFSGLAWQRPQFLVYRPGDHFQWHQDGSRWPGAERVSRGRRVAAVVFLNAPGPDDAEGFDGGQLSFCGLLTEPRLRRLTLSVDPEPGLLLAFRADVWHAVTPVTRGERYTVVDWLAEPDPAP